MPSSSSCGVESIVAAVDDSGTSGNAEFTVLLYIFHCRMLGVGSEMLWESCDFTGCFFSVVSDKLALLSSTRDVVSMAGKLNFVRGRGIGVFGSELLLLLLELFILGRGTGKALTGGVPGDSDDVGLIAF